MIDTTPQLERVLNAFGSKFIVVFKTSRQRQRQRLLYGTLLARVFKTRVATNFCQYQTIYM